MPELMTSLELDDGNEISVTVSYNYHAGCPQWFDYRQGVGGPEEPAELEIYAIETEINGKWIEVDASESPYTLSDYDKKKLEQQCWEAVIESDKYEYEADY